MHPICYYQLLLLARSAMLHQLCHISHIHLQVYYILLMVYLFLSYSSLPIYYTPQSYPLNLHSLLVVNLLMCLYG